MFSYNQTGLINMREKDHKGSMLLSLHHIKGTCYPHHWLRYFVRFPHCKVTAFSSVSCSMGYPLEGSNQTQPALKEWRVVMPPLDMEYLCKLLKFWGFPGGSDGKESNCNVGDLGSIPGLGRSPGEGNDCPLTEQSGGPQCMRLQRVRHDQATKHNGAWCIDLSIHYDFCFKSFTLMRMDLWIFNNFVYNLVILHFFGQIIPAFVIETSFS